MYLPTPKGMTKNNVVQIASKNKLLALSTEDNFCDEEGMSEEDEVLTGRPIAVSARPKQSWTPTSVISALSPAAPRKTFKFLARTLYRGKEHNENHTSNNEDYTEEELSSLVQPKQLLNLNSFRSGQQDTSRRGKASRRTYHKIHHASTNAERKESSLENTRDENLTRHPQPTISSKASSSSDEAIRED